MLYDTAWLIHVIHLSKSTEHTTPTVNLNVSYVHWMIIMCQCRFIYYNKCTTVAQDINNGESWGVGQGKIGFIGTLCTFCSVLL